LTSSGSASPHEMAFHRPPCIPPGRLKKDRSEKQRKTPPVEISSPSPIKVTICYIIPENRRNRKTVSYNLVKLLKILSSFLWILRKNKKTEPPSLPKKRFCFI
jgi:hypothetical protein